jgi:hypothetical protein
VWDVLLLSTAVLVAQLETAMAATPEDNGLTVTAVPREPERLRTNLLGEFAVAKVFLRAIEKGVRVSRPLIECRYDLIPDDGNLYRAQVKYAGGKCPKQVNGVIPVGLKKWRTDGRRPIWHYTAEEIAVVLVYLRATDQILWFGPEVFVGRTMLYIRLEPARNGQKKGCLMAADYVW